MDLNVIVVKSLDSLSESYTGSESETHVAVGVLRFAPTTGNGRNILLVLNGETKVQVLSISWYLCIYE